VNGKRIVIVIPTYNESSNVRDLVNRIVALDIPDLHLVIVDDSSPDGTGILAHKLSQECPSFLTVLHQPIKLGLKSAYLVGFQEAFRNDAEIIVQMDADLSHPPEELPFLLGALENADLVIGSRYIHGGSLDKHWNKARRLLSLTGNIYVRWATGLKLRDNTSGYKVFRTAILNESDLRNLKCRGFAFQVEVNCLIHRRGFRIREYPINFPKRIRGESKLTWGIIWEAIWRLPMIR